MITEDEVNVGVNGDEKHVMVFANQGCFRLTADEACELGRWLQDESTALRYRQANERMT